MTTAKKKFKNLFYRGNMTKGEYGKGYYGILNLLHFSRYLRISRVEEIQDMVQLDQ